MKQLFMMVSLVFSIACNATCSENRAISAGTPDPQLTGTKMKIKIGSKTFSATLYDNPTATAFKSLLPLKVEMVELNGNEKYADLPRRLPTASSNPGTIQNGDLMLYGSSTLVLFYKTFSTSYSYTKLGSVDDVAGLAAALGAGDVEVRFELE
jgi:hypothetical protein